ncbi:hypothetical protein Kpho02_37160 [Kitasatospora phosalacinea]|uniref:Maltogenic amylase-like C-terminal domain-containing protein n=2 Tax=Kitasatospora phosalacinea TaxID=2065 RepID=A0A9W6V3M3_9ACTN|nr:alpha-glucosidase C-terminal domain-containing protein [Kitasatospora phosalacinea]GLW71417.1 hypothetical protein Kpho02_37160 [Kitasatospora phosalacinea]
MGENLAADGRLAVRTPMQWAPGPTAGFSGADPARYPRPLTRGAFGPDRVNVRDQAHDPHSLLSRMRSFVQGYREAPELAWGRCEILDAGDPAVLAHLSSTGDGAILVLHNFAGRPVTATTAGVPDGRLTDILTGAAVERAADAPRVELPPYGYRWLRVGEP